MISFRALAPSISDSPTGDHQGALLVIAHSRLIAVLIKISTVSINSTISDFGGLKRFHCVQFKIQTAVPNKRHDEPKGHTRTSDMTTDFVR